MTRNGLRNLASSVRNSAFRWRLLLSAAVVLSVCLAARYYWGARISQAQQPIAPSPSTAVAPTTSAPPQSIIPEHKAIPDIVATVNGDQITREELAQECRARYGKEVLEAMVNKALILQECRERGISVTRQEVEQDVEQMAKSFNMSVEQWLRLLKDERGIRPEQYAEDIIWPSLALKKLAGDSLVVTPEEFNAAFETEFGPTVKARVIICANLEKAKEVQAKAAANPADFGNLAKTYSEDAPSACVKGLIQPIRKNGPCPEVERVAFAMADGQVSNVISSAGQYVIVKRDGMTPGNRVNPEEVRPRLEKMISERKLRTVAGDIFKKLQQRAKVQNVYNDPQLSRQYGPGVVALINGAPIYLRQLDEECMARHGAELLDSLVDRRLIEHACRSQNVTVTEQEIDAEIARIALEMMKPLANGAPDVRKWLEVVVKNQGISPDIYRRTQIWPAVALRKLAAGKIDVTEDDIAKGFEANYGPRVRCRAIVLNNERRAQEVWEKARQLSTPDRVLTAERFGELAAKYSVEGSSRALEGMVPPIRRNSGQPMLEEEAFKLKPNELSGVIELGDKWVILFCEGYTDPIAVDRASVREVLIADIRQKKQRMAMSEYFARVQESATVVNVLDPSASRSPKKNASAGTRGTALPVSYEAPASQADVGK